MGRQEAKEISDRMSRIQGKGKDEKRESTSSPYDSLHLMDNDAIPEIPKHQKYYDYLGINHAETSSSSPRAPSPRATLTPRQPSTRWSPWGTTLTAPDLAEEFAQNAPYSGQLAVHSTMNAPETDGVLKSKAHHSDSGEDSIEPTRRGWPVPLNIDETFQREKQKTSATIVSDEQNKMDDWFDSSRLSRAQQEGKNIAKLRGETEEAFKKRQDAEKEKWRKRRHIYGYYHSDFPLYFPSAATPSPRYMDATERRESPSERYLRAHSRHGPTPSPRQETFERAPRPLTTDERIYSTDNVSNWLKEALIEWPERIRQEQKRRGILIACLYLRSNVSYFTPEQPKSPTQHELWSEQNVPKETEDVPFQYQDPRQTLLKAQHNGTNSRGRILAQRRKKRSPRKKTQHNPLDSSLDLSASAEKRSREDETPSRTEPQLMGRHKLSDWKLQNGKSKDWRRKPSAKTLTARQFLTAIHSHKQLHCSTVQAEVLEMAGFNPDIPVAAQRSSRGKTSMVVRNYFPAYLPWLDRKGSRDMGMKRDRMRDIFDEGEFEVEAHRKLGL